MFVGRRARDWRNSFTCAELPRGARDARAGACDLITGLRDDEARLKARQEQAGRVAREEEGRSGRSTHIVAFVDQSIEHDL